MSAPTTPVKPGTFAAWLQQPAHAASLPLPPTNASLPVLVVGAGPFGLAAMHALSSSHIAYQAVDSAPDVGGLWSPANPASPAYSSLVTNSSRYTTHLAGPADPSFPSHVPRQQAADYLRRFAEQHGLLPHIALRTTVTRVRKSQSNAWTVSLTNAATGESSDVDYRAVIVAVGPQSKATARVPKDLAAMADAAGIPWKHSAEYRSPAAYAGKSVLVVGIGNSGSEVATEISAVAQQCRVSVRTSPWIVPLHILGIPSDLVARLSHPMPYAVQMAVFHAVQRLYCGHPESLGFAPPNHDLLERLPVLDRGLCRALRAKRITVVGNIVSMRKGAVTFTGGEEAHAVDAILFATGWRREYPFLPEGSRSLEPGGLQLCLTVLHPTEAGLLFMPEIVVPQSTWPMATAQAEAIAAYLQADGRRSPRVAEVNARRSNPSPDIRGNLFKVGSSAPPVRTLFACNHFLTPVLPSALLCRLRPTNFMPTRWCMRSSCTTLPPGSASNEHNKCIEMAAFTTKLYMN